jgi:hypothetical protein
MLEARYFIGNLEPSDRANGFISILHPPEWFATVIDGGGVHVAVTDDEEVVGFMAVTPPPDPAEAALPAVIKGMLDLAETL